MEAKTDCPLCGCGTAHVNNHVRMTNDEVHGPTQTYPDGWDKSKEQLENDPDDEEGQTAGTLEIPDDRDDEPDAVPLEIEARPSDMREYECPDCETPVDYLDDECANEHEQRWYAE